jgi:DHA2 family multidrug resistance protein
MVAMLIAGRIMGRVDLRFLLLAGFTITAFALWQMAGYSFDISESDVIWPGVIQGIGLGFVFVPLSAATFVTLSPEMRAQGTAIFSLVRNIGSSIGISMVQTLLVRGTVKSHAALVEQITHANPAWNHPAVASVYDLARPSGAAALDGMITQQAAMIAYLNDFRLMLYLTLAVIPLLFFLRAPKHAPAGEAHAVLD